MCIRDRWYWSRRGWYWSRRGWYWSRRGSEKVALVDDVAAIQRHCTNVRQGSAGYACAGIQGDALIRNNGSCDVTGCTESRGTAHPPKHVAILTAIDHLHNRATRGRERAHCRLENPDRIGVAHGVEIECSRQNKRPRGTIDAWRERKSTQILAT